MYDIAIIGAGPAGATLARLVGPRYRVLLIEKNSGDGPGKCCGGLLAPDAQRMLSTLGLGLPKSVLQDPQLFVVRAIDIPQRLERYYQRHYINMDRRQFDQTVRREGTLLLRPKAAGQVAIGTKGIVLIGEAAGWISPSSAEGLSYAFRSAQILAEVLRTGLENIESRYRRAAVPLRRNILLKGLKSRVVFHPGLRRLVMKLGIQSMDIYSMLR